MKDDGDGRTQQMSRIKTKECFSFFFLFFLQQMQPNTIMGSGALLREETVLMSVSPVKALIKLAVFCSSFCAPQGDSVYALKV